MERMGDEPVVVLSYEAAGARDNFPWVVHFVGMGFAVLVGVHFLFWLSDAFQRNVPVAVLFLFSVAAMFLTRWGLVWGGVAVVSGVVAIPKGSIIRYGGFEFDGLYVVMAMAGYVLGVRMIALARWMRGRQRWRDTIEAQIGGIWARLRGEAVGLRGQLAAARRRRELVEAGRPFWPVIIYLASLPVLEYMRVEAFWGREEWLSFGQTVVVSWLTAGVLWRMQQRPAIALQLLMQGIGLLLVAWSGFAASYVLWQGMRGGWSELISSGVVASAGVLLVMGRPWALWVAIVGMMATPVVEAVMCVGGQRSTGAAIAIAYSLVAPGLLAYLWRYQMTTGRYVGLR